MERSAADEAHLPKRVHIVGLGGTTRPGSSSERALRITLKHAEALGTSTQIFTGTDLASLETYTPGVDSNCTVAAELIDELRRADGVVIASPGYHGSMSGLIKNALDYAEEMREDPRPYFADRAVGMIVTAYGWQGCVTTLQALRSVVHALRGWPTPYGAVINSQQSAFDEGGCRDDSVNEQLRIVASEVATFAHGMARAGL